jgi:hypothetical protein
LFSRAKAALAVSVANPVLDQFSHALFWKAGVVIILASFGALLLREGLQWLERRACAVRPRTARAISQT